MTSQRIVDDAVELFRSVLVLIRAHPKKAFALFIFELWVHSLMFQHLSELKSIREILPF